MWRWGRKSRHEAKIIIESTTQGRCPYAIYSQRFRPSDIIVMSYNTLVNSLSIGGLLTDVFFIFT